ncbi:MAG: cell envelope integrity protein CreD [Flavobacteriaceae bacterium]|nr:cell envelope integrity protein CreD [Flavobacteriaceae bacterium]
MEQKSENKFSKWVKNSTTVRMLMMGLLILILMIPLKYIKSLIIERSERQKSVISEINDKWGKEVLLYGPILKIPYKTYIKTTHNKGEKTAYTTTKELIKHAYFFPEKLNASTTVNPERKHRGIYKTAVYQTSMNIEGSFKKPNFNSIDIKNEDVIWKKARIIINTSNLKGINNEVKIRVNKSDYSFTPKYENNKNNEYNSEIILHKLESSFIAIDDLPKNNTSNFKISININGSESIKIIPIGKETTLNIKSSWTDKSFIGNFLPYQKGETATNFDAKWRILQINRPFPQQFLNKLPNLNEFSLGVNFMIPVNQYQQSERTAKYGYLVIFLTFLIFFLIQSLSKINIHPFQYLMIGLALTMFYTLLISISEHSTFLKAYLIASISVISLITLYSKSILKTIKFPILILISLTSLYTFIYVIIQLESYALLVGSIGLFLILGCVMYASRKVDWN